MSYFMVYLILILDNIADALKSIDAILSVLFLIILVFSIVTFFSDEPEDEKIVNLFSIIKKVAKIFIPIYILIVGMSILCPTTKQAATIYLLPKIASNKSLQQLPAQTSNLLLLEVKKEIASLKDSTITEVKKDVAH